VEGFFFREALFLFAVAQVGAGELHEVFGVSLIHDREIARETCLGTELSEEAVPGRVERSALDSRRRRSYETLGATQHLVCGAAGEGEEEDALGRDTAVDEMGDPVDERSCLAGARAGDDEEGSLAVSGGHRLLGVELRGEVPRGWLNVAFARGIDAGHVRHAGQYRFGERSG